MATDLAKAAEKVWSMLDKLAEENPSEYKTFVEQQMKEGVEHFQPPSPAYCYSCNVTYRGKDSILYVNVCKWSQVPPPKSNTDPIGVRGGTLRYFVKKGVKTGNYLIDIAFNPQVIDECMKDPTMCDMLNSLSLDFISDTTKLLLYRKTFKNIKSSFKGPKNDIHCSLDEHLKDGLTPASKLDICDSLLDQLANLNTSSETLPALKLHPGHTKPGKLIEELPSCVTQPLANATKEKEPHVDTQQQIKVPSFTLEIKMTDDSRHKMLIVVVSLSGVSSVKDVELEVSQNELFLNVPTMYEFNLPFHSPIDEDQVNAEFSTKKSELTITAPLL